MARPEQGFRGEPLKTFQPEQVHFQALGAVQSDRVHGHMTPDCHSKWEKQRAGEDLPLTETWTYLGGKEAEQRWRINVT